MIAHSTTWKITREGLVSGVSSLMQTKITSSRKRPAAIFEFAEEFPSNTYERERGEDRIQDILGLRVDQLVITKIVKRRTGGVASGHRAFMNFPMEIVSTRMIIMNVFPDLFAIWTRP